MRKVKTIWNYSWETEADRIIQASVNTANRFYLKYGFLVLPRPVKGNGRTVYLPELDFGQIPGYWSRVAKFSLDSIPVSTDLKLTERVKKLLLEKNFELETEKFKKLQVAWQEKERQFWPLLLGLFPFLSKKEISLEVRPTSFGTTSSFNVLNLKDRKLSVKMIIRMDISVAHLAEGVISSLLWQKLEREGYDWEEREACFDAFLKFTKLAKLFPDYQPTLEIIRQKENGRLAQESREYVKRLGISSREIFSVQNKNVLIDEKLPVVSFSLEEEKVLKFLVENKSRLCSVEQIGETIWKEKTDEKFSLWAVAKLIERLRKKLLRNGISSAVIQSQRGRGYLLMD